MAKVSFFIDGFNVYHSLKSNPKYHKYLWLDFYALAKRFVRKSDTLADVFYFSALATWKPDAMKRHNDLIEALKNSGVHIILGKFKEKDRFCTNCNSYYKAHEEKQTDMNMGIYLLKEAFFNKYDTAIVLTNDTDLIPSLKMVKATFPQKKIGVLFPIDRWSSELRQECDFWRKVRKKDLSKSQLPDPVTLPSGRKLIKPVKWN